MPNICRSFARLRSSVAQAAQSGDVDALRACLSEWAESYSSEKAQPLPLATHHGINSRAAEEEHATEDCFQRRVLHMRSLTDTHDQSGGEGTPLWVAANNGHVDVIHALIDEGHASVDLPGKRDSTSVAVAIERSLPSTLQALLSRGASVDAIVRRPLEEKKTDLLAAPRHNGGKGEKGMDDAMKAMWATLGGGEDDDDEEEDVAPLPLPPPPITAAVVPIMIAARRGNLSTLQALLDGGADPNTRVGSGIAETSVLLEALKARRVEAAVRLIGEGAVVVDDLQPRMLGAGNSLLMHAIELRDTVLLKTMLSRGADPNGVALSPSVHVSVGAPHTPLTFAAKHMCEAIPILIAAGADPNRPQRNGVTPLLMAISSKCLGAAQALIAAHRIYNAPRRCLTNSAAVADNAGDGFTAPQRLVDINDNSFHGMTPLAYALIHACGMRFVKTLLTAGADPNIPVTFKHQSPLHTAVLAHHYDPEAVDWLLAHGAGVSAAEAAEGGVTALHEAVRQGNAGAVQKLLDHGADLDAIATYSEEEDGDAVDDGAASVRACEQQPLNWVEDSARLLTRAVIMAESSLH